jgi:HSP20 family protein
MELMRQNGNGVRPYVTSLRPFAEFDRLFSEMAAPLAARTQDTFAANLYETDSDFVFEMAVPGIRVDDLDISIEGRQLTVQGNYPQADSEGRRYWLQSMPTGNFNRTLTLPSHVNVDAVNARVANGVLILTMPKVEEAKARRIAISNE